MSIAEIRRVYHNIPSHMYHLTLEAIYHVLKHLEEPSLKAVDMQIESFIAIEQERIEGPSLDLAVSDVTPVPHLRLVEGGLQ